MPPAPPSGRARRGREADGSGEAMEVGRHCGETALQERRRSALGRRTRCRAKAQLATFLAAVQGRSVVLGWSPDP